MAQRSDATDDGLRFAPDWRAPALARQPLHNSDIQIPYLPGWQRPIRLGVLVSLKSLKVPVEAIANKEQQQPDGQVWTTQAIVHPGIQMVGIVEPRTSCHGAIERTLRDFELTAGLIDGTDLDALRTLDVILLGVNYAMDAKVAAAFNAVVHEGVGLLNDFWTNVYSSDDANTMDLMLASSPVRRHHIQPKCGTPLSATVIEEHPLLPGLRRGNSYSVYGCGPLYRVKEDAKVLIAKDRVIQPHEHGIPGLGPAQMPVYIVGRLGRGRVVVANVINHPNFAKATALPSDYLYRLLSYLAEPRRLQQNFWDIAPAAGENGAMQLAF